MTHPTRADYQLIIRETDWRDALRPLSVGRAPFAAGRLRLDLTRCPTGLLVRDLELSESAVGSDYAPMDAWCAIVMPNADASTSANDWIKRLRPSFAQRFVLLVIGLGQDRRGWECWLVHRGQMVALSQFHVIGGDGFHVGGQNGPDFFDNDPERFSRVSAAVGPGFAQLRHSSVALIGCSRSGTLAATMLASLGVRRIVLMDGDRIERHNLDGMFFATESDLGSFKSNVIADRLNAYRSSLAITPVCRSLGSRIEDPEIGHCDLVVTCVDQDGPRMQAAVIAHRRMIPHLDIWYWRESQPFQWS